MQKQQFNEILKNQTPLKKLKIHNNTATSMTKAALPIIHLINKIQNNNIAYNIKDTFIEHLAKFETSLLNQHYSKEKIYTSRIFLCAWLDEAVAKSKTSSKLIIGSQSITQTINLNHNIHSTACYITNEALKNPKENKDILEIIFICCHMGYEKIFSNLKDQDSIKNQIYYRLIHMEKQLVAKKNQHTKKERFNNYSFIIFAIILITIFLLSYV